jgi:hypothetical protein
MIHANPVEHVYSDVLIVQGTLPPVYGASEGGHLTIVELLVSQGARIDQPCDVRLIIFCMVIFIGKFKVSPTKTFIQ